MINLLELEEDVALMKQDLTLLKREMEVLEERVASIENTHPDNDEVVGVLGYLEERIEDLEEKNEEQNTEKNVDWEKILRQRTGKGRKEFINLHLRDEVNFDKLRFKVNLKKYVELEGEV